jgi:biotin synthase-like enzyme
MPLTREISEIKSRAEAYRENSAGDFWIGAAGRTGRQNTNSDHAVRDGSSCSSALCLCCGIERSCGLHIIGSAIWVHNYSLRIHNNSKTDRRHRVHRGRNLDHSLPVN